jgi:CBS domain-containing protein
MKQGVPAVEPEERLTAAAARMRRDGVSALTVMEEGRLVGIITERDLLRAVADGLSTDVVAVAAYMTAAPRTIGAGEEARQAAERMLRLQVRHLPVVRGDRVVGVISARDLLRLPRTLPARLLGTDSW